MSERLRVRLVGSQDNGENGIEWRADVSDPSLSVDTDARLHAIWNNGDDFFCVYGSTALDAIREGVESVHGGFARRYFQDIRRIYGLTDA